MAINKDLIVDDSSVIVDARSMSTLLWGSLTEYPSPIFLLLFSIILLAMMPGFFLAICLIMAIIKMAYAARPDVLPIHLPFVHNTPFDKNDPSVSGSGFNKPQGVVLLGNVIGSLEQVYCKFESILRHLIIIGTTGAGKTETLLSIFANFLAFGSGGQYTDAKGTSKFWVQLFTQSRFFGREDDTLLINFNKGNTSEKFDPADRISHTTAPFSFGSADSGIQLTNSLMPEDSGGSNKVFHESAVALISSVFPALVDLRDVGLLQIDPRTIRKYTNYADYCQLMRHPMVSEASRQSMLGFIRTRSGYTETKTADKQPEEVMKQFGFAQAYFARCLQMLADTYGNIYMYGTGEVDFRDAILNDRIVCTILPSMTKSTAELGSLGKLILSAKKSAYSIGLGIQVQGQVEDIVDALPMATNRPIIDINDEYAFMAVKGYAITAAQCRGINVVVCIAGQDWAGIKKADPDEAEQFWANSRIKYFMASEGDSDTWPKIRDMASQVYAYVRKGKSIDENSSMGSSYINDKSINLEKVDALKLSDLRKLNEGEGVLFFQSKMLFIRNFWHGQTRSDFAEHIRVFTKVRPIVAPKRGDFAALFDNGNLSLLNTTEVWLRNLEKGDIDTKSLPKSQRLDTVVELFRGSKLDRMSGAEKGISLLHGYSKSDSIRQSLQDEQLLGDSQNVLTNRSGTLGGTSLINELSGGLLMSGGLSTAKDSTDDIESATAIIEDLFESARKNNAISYNDISSMFDDDGKKQQAVNTTTSKKDPSKFSLSSLKTYGMDDEQSAPSAQEELTDNFDEIGSLPTENELEFYDEDSSSDDIFSSNFKRRIAHGTSKIEAILGATKEQADEIGRMNAEALMESTQYPKNKLESSPDNQERVKDIMARFVNSNKSKKND